MGIPNLVEHLATNPVDLTAEQAGRGTVDTSWEASPLNVVGPHNFCGGGPKSQWSGYLPAGRGASYFFWLAKSDSMTQDDGSPTPLVLWLTGGPGCSSTLAFLFENGPCRIDGGSAEHGWQTSHRDTSWTKKAHMLWVEQPAGVGFSDGPGWSADERHVADHMYNFFESFYAYEAFANLFHVPLFITLNLLLVTMCLQLPRSCCRKNKDMACKHPSRAS